MAHLSMMDGERYVQATWPLRAGINVYIPLHDRMGRIHWTQQGGGIPVDPITGLRAQVAVMFLDAAGQVIVDDRVMCRQTGRLAELERPSGTKMAVCNVCGINDPDHRSHTSTDEDSVPMIYHLAHAREKLVRVDAIIREEPW